MEQVKTAETFRMSRVSWLRFTLRGRVLCVETVERVDFDGLKKKLIKI